VQSFENHLKKGAPAYIERDEEERKKYCETPVPYGAEIVYVDECGIEEFMSRTHGRAPSGERLNVPKPGRKFKRLNVVAGYSSKTKQVIAPCTYSWNTVTAWFLVWFEYFLLPLLSAGTIIVLDNASFHNKKRIIQLARMYNCIVVFLPKYSPDLNMAEKLWANLKNWLRLNSKQFENLQLAVKRRLSM
jgi:transposase